MKTNATTANCSRWLLEFLRELSFMGKAKSKFYSVRVGRRTGVYTTWRECEQNILGVSKAEFKSFATFEEAVNYLGTPADAPQVCPQATPVSNLPGASSSISRDGNGLLTFNQRATISSSPACSVSSLQSLGAGTWPVSPQLHTRQVSTSSSTSCPPIHSPSQESTAQTLATSFSAASPSSSQPHPTTSTSQPSRKTPSKSKINDNDFVFDLEVYTDGSCLGNGKNHAKAGIGVFFGPSDPRNISEKLPGSVQTNNRAEVLAAIRALEATPKHLSVKILSDSTYLRQGISLWMTNWKKNGWKTAKGTPVLNQDLWQRLDMLIDLHENHVKFVYVKAHCGIFGNEEADRLANEGAWL